MRAPPSPTPPSPTPQSTRPARRPLAAPGLGLLSLAVFLAACSPSPTTDANAGASGPAVAAEAPQPEITLANFTLSDETGAQHELYALKDKSAVVLAWQGNGCPIVRKLMPTLKDVAAEYREKNVAFLMVNANIQDTPESIAAESADFAFGIPVLKDEDQSLSRSLGVERTAEVFVVDPKTWKVAFHGPIDDRLTYGLEKPQAEHHYVRDTLDAVLAGREPPHVKTTADGCLINYVKS